MWSGSECIKLMYYGSYCSEMPVEEGEGRKKKPKKGSCHCQKQLGTGSSAEQWLLAEPLHLEVECE